MYLRLFADKASVFFVTLWQSLHIYPLDVGKTRFIYRILLINTTEIAITSIDGNPALNIGVIP